MFIIGAILIVFGDTLMPIISAPVKVHLPEGESPSTEGGTSSTE